MLDESFAAVIREVMTDLRTKLRASQTEQGHTLTGRLRDSIDYDIQAGSGAITAKMEMENYGVFVEFGVPASSIPKRGERGYMGMVYAMINFFEIRGLSGRESVSAAHATVHVWGREGMPTRASSRYSRTGERTGFIKTVLQDEVKNISDKIEKDFGIRIEFLFGENFKGFENLIVR